MNIEARVREVICDQLGVKPEEVSPGSELIKDLELDSLDSVELIMAIEEEFNIEISDEDAAKMNKVQDIIQYVLEKLGNK